MELECIDAYISECIHKEARIDREILQLLIRVAMQKIDYYGEKYDLNIRSGDTFFVENALEFFRHMGEVQSWKKKLYCKGEFGGKRCSGTR